MPDKSDRLYFDYAASNPLWPEAAAAVAEAARLTGNPSATHCHGREARRWLDESRQAVAVFLDVADQDLVFTSGATEANNLALFGLLGPITRAWKQAQDNGRPPRPPRLLTSRLEHASVNRAAAALADREGLALDWLAISESAIVEPERLKQAIGPDTVAVCLTAANNTLGSIQPLAEVGALIAEIRREREAVGNSRPLFFISDAVQAAAWLKLRPRDWGLDALMISGHKAGGPKGIGCLWRRPGLTLEPLLYGGGQEFGWRSGTENLPGTVGLAAALRVVNETREAETERCRGLRQRLLAGLSQNGVNCRLLGAGERHALPGTAFIHFPGQLADALAVKLGAAGMSVATGSACEAGQRRSSALLAEAYGSSVAKWGGLRISFGRFTDTEQVDRLVAAISRTAR